MTSPILRTPQPPRVPCAIVRGSELSLLWMDQRDFSSLRVFTVGQICTPVFNSAAMGGLFVRSPLNPILPAIPHTWMESQAEKPDLLRVGNAYHLYFRGQRGGHDSTG